ncbi:allatostatin C [Cataglyphis hispanica]|nr:allatostatin C [Cataglyphis hispanica]
MAVVSFFRERRVGFRYHRPLPAPAGGSIKWSRAPKLGHSVAETSKRRRYPEIELLSWLRIQVSPSLRSHRNERRTNTGPARDSIKMSSVRNAATLALVLLVLAEWSVAMPTTDTDKDRLLNTVDLIDDDGSIETALINYLFTKQIVKRLRSQLDIGDLQRKRSYWKQCAFNAVSCFGK